ncbi:MULTISPECIES: ABC transporter ATP-binding protein [Staphylococcus]|uniref:ABC transporter ATP-binding protein n=1 Tax=Staphylococcus lugdunensis TaxID=28035 RepID=A0ABX6BSX9_STALU|nr:MULTISPECIES: ABC transporter ATP-binding protein [Staphylococcus]ADC88573.1 ABC transporter ATP-binding protein [Staphylococcus lugdunensis HKU09-01]ARJ17297.1 peptide ABC transporter ATP-binding protein [Staphylococcus lugdunensis]ARJ30757.1 peptide ABC transporter ATP-binding protein [Staphylococcus lugdunensis]MCH8639912.1 ABC transporter ATP-binding protein [Staphylococcus lugdunensis]MCH8651224.1 ABC transporter ATP-binding protein [Staphylococcus lugdunensis]
MIELKGVNRAFKNGNETTQVLKDINLNIQAGEFIAVMGPSGSGKSTLINILGFIDRGYSGIYNFEHESYKQSSDSKLAEIRNRTVGFVFQNFKLIQNHTIFENVSIPLIYNGMPAKKRSVRVKQRLADVGLTGKENLLPSKLSGGQQQRVAIARAIVNEPRFIIADEPTGALDSETSKEIMALFGSLNKAQQTTLIMVTHDRKVAEQADRIIHILDGRIQSEEVMTHEQFI